MPARPCPKSSGKANPWRASGARPKARGWPFTWGGRPGTWTRRTSGLPMTRGTPTATESCSWLPAARPVACLLVASKSSTSALWMTTHIFVSRRAGGSGSPSSAEGLSARVGGGGRNGKKVGMAFPEESIGSRMSPADLAKFLKEFYQQKGVEVLAGQVVYGLETHAGRPVLKTRNAQGQGERGVLVDGVVAGI